MQKLVKSKAIMPQLISGNIEQYDMKACLELLRNLHCRQSAYLGSPENKVIISRLENRLKMLVLSK